MSFTISDGRWGPMLSITSAWDSSIRQQMVRHSIAELEINYAKGWQGDNVEFLRELPFLISLDITDFNLKDVSSVSELTRLRFLGVETYGRIDIQFARLIELEECALEWGPGAFSLWSAPPLKKLFLNKYPGKDTSRIARFRGLISLRLASARIAQCEDLKECKDLSMLGFYHCRNLRSLTGMNGLRKLTHLEVDGCKSIGTFDSLQDLIQLERLSFCNSGKIESLNSLKHLKNLRAVFFYEDTRIMDGDMTSLLELPLLREVAFRNRRNYSHRCEDIEAILKARQHA